MVDFIALSNAPRKTEIERIRRLQADRDRLAAIEEMESVNTIHRKNEQSRLNVIQRKLGVESTRLHRWIWLFCISIVLILSFFLLKRWLETGHQLSVLRKHQSIISQQPEKFADFDARVTLYKSDLLQARRTTFEFNRLALNVAEIKERIELLAHLCSLQSKNPNCDIQGLQISPTQSYLQFMSNEKGSVSSIHTWENIEEYINKNLFSLKQQISLVSSSLSSAVRLRHLVERAVEKSEVLRNPEKTGLVWNLLNSIELEIPLDYSQTLMRIESFKAQSDKLGRELITLNNLVTKVISELQSDTNGIELPLIMTDLFNRLVSTMGESDASILDMINQNFKSIEELQKKLDESGEQQKLYDNKLADSIVSLTGEVKDLNVFFNSTVQKELKDTNSLIGLIELLTRTQSLMLNRMEDKNWALYTRSFHDHLTRHISHEISDSDLFIETPNPIFRYPGYIECTSEDLEQSAISTHSPMGSGKLPEHMTNIKKVVDYFIKEFNAEFAKTAGQLPVHKYLTLSFTGGYDSRSAVLCNEASSNHDIAKKRVLLFAKEVEEQMRRYIQCKVINGEIPENPSKNILIKKRLNLSTSCLRVTDNAGKANCLQVYRNDDRRSALHWAIVNGFPVDRDNFTALPYPPDSQLSGSSSGDSIHCGIAENSYDSSNSKSVIR